MVSSLRRVLPWLGPMALGLALRLPGLASRPAWYDEAFSVLLAARPIPDLLAGTAADTMPPAYYLALWLWMKVGTSLVFLRLLNVIMGVVVVGLVFVIARRSFGEGPAVWASLLAASSPLLIHQSQELRMYTLLVVALGAYAYLVLRVLDDSEMGSRTRLWVGIVSCGTLALYTHNLAIFSLAAPNVYLLARRDWRKLARLVLAQLAMLGLFLPWLIVVPGQVAKIQAAFWTPRPGAVEIVQAVVGFHSALPMPASWLPLAVASSVLALVLTGYLVARQGRTLPWTGFLVTLVLVPPGLLFLASYIMRPLFVPRAFLLSLLAYLVLAGWAIAEARPRPLGWIVAASFAFSAAVGVPATLSHDTFPRSPFDRAVVDLRATIEPGDVIVHDNKLSFFPMWLYGPDLPQRFLPDEPGSHNDTLAGPTQAALQLFPATDIEQAVEGAQRVRFVIFERAIEEYALISNQDPPALAWLEAHATPGEIARFNDLRVYDFVLAP